MKILSIGDLLLDLVVRYDAASGEADTGADAVRIEPGGSAANFAVQAARLGAQTHFVSRVGRDWAGDMLVRSLQAEGVISHVLNINEEPSGRVLVMVNPQGHRRMWSYPGASRTLHPDDLDPTWFADLDAFHLTGYSLLRQGPGAAATTALELAKAGGAPLCTLDPNPGHLIADYGPARFREVIEALRFDIIFPSLEEGQLLTDEESPEAVAGELLKIAPIVALTLGADGCLVMGGSEAYRVAAAPSAQVVDVTGAGDAFAAGFVIEYLRSRNLLDAATAANSLAAGVVGRTGGR
jgi:sugar/nucleoside kinase (ribokinase family)